MTALRPRVLLVEGDPLIALLVTQLLDELGWECIGPIIDLPSGLHQAEQGLFEAAILNFIIGGEHAYSVANALATRGIPFGFASGVPRDGLEGLWKDRPYLSKPYELGDLRLFLGELLGGEPERPSPPAEHLSSAPSISGAAAFEP